jgi:hypothetical protein
VRGFKEHLPLFHYFKEEEVALLHAPLHNLGSPDKQVQCKRRRDALSDLNSFSVGFAFKRQNDEQIDIGIGRGLSVGVGTEEDDLVWTEFFRDPFDERRDLTGADHVFGFYAE